MTSRTTNPTLRDRKRTKKSRKPARGRKLRMEALEDRRLLATFSESGATLNLILDQVNESVAIVSNTGPSYTLTLTGGTWSGTNSTRATGNTTSTLTVTIAGRTTFNTVNIGDSATGAAVTFNNSANTYDDTFNITLDAAPAGTITFNGATSFTGTAALSASTSKNIVVSSGAGVATVDGGLTLSANATTATAGSFYGIEVNGATVTSTGTGSISLSGRGGTSSSNNYGVWIHNVGQVYGGAGSVSINGTGGSGSGTSGSNHGVRVEDSGSTVTSAGGSVTVTGSGGGELASGTNNFGVAVVSSGTITAGGTGAVSINGTGGAGRGDYNRGVHIANSGIVTSGGGSVTVTGTKLNTASGEDVLVNTSGTITTANHGGAITVIGNSMNLPGTGTIVGGGTVVLQPRSAGTKINLGGADAAGTLGLTDAELDSITASWITIGSAAAGNVTFTAAVDRASSDTFQILTGGAVYDTVATTAFTGTRLTIDAGQGVGTSSPLKIAVSNFEAAGGTGAVRVAETDGLTLGGIGALAGVSSGGGAIDVSTGGGLTLNSNQAVSASGSGAIQLTSTGTMALSSGCSITSTNGAITLTADDMALDLTSTLVAASTVTLAPLTAGRGIDLGTKTAGQLGFTDAELDRITAPTIQIGNSSSGPILVSTAIDRAAATNLALTSAETVSLYSSDVFQQTRALPMPGASRGITSLAIAGGKPVAYFALEFGSTRKGPWIRQNSAADGSGTWTDLGGAPHKSTRSAYVPACIVGRIRQLPGSSLRWGDSYPKPLRRNLGARNGGRLPLILQLGGICEREPGGGFLGLRRGGRSEVCT